MSARVYIVEDNETMREGIVKILPVLADVTISGVSESAEKALAHLQERTGAGAELDIDVALIDLSLPGMSGIEAVTAIKKQWPALSCIIFSGHGESSYVSQALDVGAKGFILKGNPYELKGAIEQVLDGETYVSPPLRP